MQNPKRIIKVTAAVALIAVLGGGGYYAYQKFNSKPAMQMVTAGVGMPNVFSEVERSDLQELITATGVVKLKDEQAVYATSKARVKDVMVEVGDQVSLGQALVTYDVETTRSDLEKQIRKAEINLSNNQLSLRSLELPKSQSETTQLKSNIDSAERSVEDSKATLTGTEAKITQQENEIALAEKDIEKAQQDIETNRKLFEVGAITQEELDKTVDALDNVVEAKNKAVDSLNDLIRQKESNERSIEAAEKNLELAKEKLDESVVDQATTDKNDEINYQRQKNAVVSSEIDLQDLRDQLADIEDETTSPLSGTVTEVSVDKGSTVDVDTALIKVADLNQLILAADISEYDAPNIAIGQNVSMTSDGIPGTVYVGKIIKISNSAQTQNAVSGTETVVPIEISVDNPDGKLRTGFNLDVEITAVDKSDVLNVPSTAIITDYKANKKYVFMPDGENLKKIEVETGVISNSRTEITSGLSERDRVITSPTDEIQDGMALSEAMGFLNTGMPAGMQGGGGDAVMFPGGPGAGQTRAIRVGP